MIFLLALLLAPLSVSYAQIPAAAADGATLYGERCASCHGASGRGDGLFAAHLNPRPSDFTTGRYKFRSTELSMNLTPDRETGLGSYTDADIQRVLRSGVSKDGTPVPGHLMPWPVYSNWTDEDLHAVVVFLRHTTPIVHKIPAPSRAILTDPAAFEEDYGGKDYAAQSPGTMK